MNLPPLVTDFVKQRIAGKVVQSLAVFAEDAVVQDEGREMRGLSAVKDPLS